MEDWKSGDDCFVIRFGDILKGKMIGSNSNNYLIVQINSAGGTARDVPFEKLDVHRTKRKCVEELLERRKFAYEMQVLKIKKEFPKEYKNILASKRVKAILK